MGFLDDVGNTLTKAFNDTGKALYGYNASNGTWDVKNSPAWQGKNEELKWAGYNPQSGQWGGSGSAPNWLGEGLGEITGRNQSRAALNAANDQFNTTQAQAQALIKQQQWDRQQNDILSSNSAQAFRSSAMARDNVSFSGSTPSSLGPQGKDFLGL